MNISSGFITKRALRKFSSERSKNCSLLAAKRYPFVKPSKKKKEEVYENFAALIELNNFENPEWTKEEAPLVDEIEIRIYQR